MRYNPETIAEIRKIAHQTVGGMNQLAAVFEFSPFDGDKAQATALKEVFQRDCNLQHILEHGIPVSENIIAKLLCPTADFPGGCHGWPHTLAVLLGFSLEGAKLSELGSETGLVLVHPRLPFSACLTERFNDQDCLYQDSLVLRCTAENK